MKRWTGVLLAGFIIAGASISGATVTGVTTELTVYGVGDVDKNETMDVILNVKKEAVPKKVALDKNFLS